MDFGAIHAIKDLGEVQKFLGLTITRDRTKRTLSISQESYTRKLVGEYLSPSDYTCPTPVSNRECCWNYGTAGIVWQG